MAANDWLHNQLRAPQATRSPAGTSTSQSWRAALSTLQGRLPALAAQLDRTVAAAAAQGQVCIPQAELDLTAPRRGIFVAKASWRQATPDDDPIQALRRALAGAAQSPTDREQALRQALGNPVAIARSALPQPPTTAGRQTAAPAQPSAPSPTSPPPTPDRRGRGVRRR